jgi:hypothetical protein
MVPNLAQDFLEMLPLPEYCHPEGALNLAGYLADNDVKPDLGPKSYVAFGRCACDTLLPACLRGWPECASPVVISLLGDDGMVLEHAALHAACGGLSFSSQGESAAVCMLVPVRRPLLLQRLRAV